MLKQNRTGNKSLSGSKFRREIAMTNRLLPYFPNVRVIEADRIRFSQSFRAAFGFLCGLECVSLCLGARNRRLRRQHPCSRFDPYFPKNTQKSSYFPKVSADPPPPRIFWSREGPTCLALVSCARRCV